MLPQKGSMIKSMSRTSRKSKNFFQKINNFFAHEKSRFNEGKLPFKPSFLISKLIEFGDTNFIKEIIKWNNLDKDEDFLQCLFDKSFFDEVSFLLYSEKYSFSWNRTKDQFRIVINNKELDLIIYFLTIRECRIVLDESGIQEFIVQNYMK